MNLSSAQEICAVYDLLKFLCLQIRKYKIANAHVAHADGRLFNLGPRAAASTAGAADAQLLPGAATRDAGAVSFPAPRSGAASSANTIDQHASPRIDADEPSATVSIADDIIPSSSGNNDIHPSGGVSDGGSAIEAAGGKAAWVAKAKHPRKRTLRRQLERALAAAALKKSAAGKISATGGDLDDDGDNGQSDGADNDDDGGVPDGEHDGEVGPSMLAPVTMAQIEALPPPAELYDKVRYSY
jgi:hypothetical protein